MRFDFETMMELQARLGRDGIGFAWVLDDRAIVREEYVDVLKRRSEAAGFGDFWSGFATVAAFDGGGLVTGNGQMYRSPGQQILSLWVHFNHHHGSVIPEGVLYVARELGYDAQWDGEGRNWRPVGEDWVPRGAKGHDLGRCVVLSCDGVA